MSKRLNISLTFLTSGSHTILVFPRQTVGLWQYSDGGVKCRGYEKSWFYRFVSEMTQARAIVTTNSNRKPYTQAFEWYHYLWPWVTSNLYIKVAILLNVKQLDNRYCDHPRVRVCVFVCLSARYERTRRCMSTKLDRHARPRVNLQEDVTFGCWSDSGCRSRVTFPPSSTFPR